ncbi:MAG: riboflavin synthase [Cycloclasticus sp.]|nr:riboflavin synthase [Cycloclasticus sp.]MBG95586.1 riboflavin synthase [Cycloclasticus sp.]HAI97200.1 riboflavin synthase [Methylococcaceae bacterium]|tara:strand:+ start:972 stop:1625 length:654 start_codon:yes stop_codon:yes gene_type:complete
MFTGIIQAVGKIKGIEQQQGDVRLTVDTADLDLSDAQLGDSIAVNGVCLTAIELMPQQFVADVSNETLSATTMGDVTVGSPVNLECALQAQTRLGGHLVSGHVDGVGRVIERKADARSIRFTFSLPKDLARYVAQKGSICIDGISLTVNKVDDSSFSVNIVPHTLEMTTLGYREVGDVVNLEVDVIARYLERLMLGESKNPASVNYKKLLEDSGFVK